MRINSYAYVCFVLLSCVEGNKDVKGKGIKGGIFGKYEDEVVVEIDAEFFTGIGYSEPMAISEMGSSSIGNPRVDKKGPKVKEYLADVKLIKDKALDSGEMLYYAAPIVPSLTFEGLSNNDNTDVNGYRVSDGDPVGAVGHKYYVQAVNDMWGMYDKKTGDNVMIKSLGSLFADDFTVDECASSAGEAKVVYDAEAKVFLIGQFSSGCWAGEEGVEQCYNCLAVLDEEDVTVRRFAIPYPSLNAEGGYPRYAVYGDYYIITVNGNEGMLAVVINKSELLDGILTYATFHATPDLYVYTALPADNDSAPPKGSPIPLVSLSYESPSLRVFEITVDFEVQTGAFTQVDDLKVAGFNLVDDRLMHRLAYQNFGDYESMVVSHSVSVGTDSENNTIASTRWYELIRKEDKYSISQQGTFHPDDAISRFMPSIAQDKFGNIAMGYSVLNPARYYPGIRVTGRMHADPAGTMTLAEGVIMDSTPAQAHSDFRRGDYTSMNVDPQDGCTFYYTNMYYAIEENCPDCWKTKIATFQLTGCD